MMCDRNLDDSIPKVAREDRNESMEFAVERYALINISPRSFESGVEIL
jgi:hypothetical protein